MSNIAVETFLQSKAQRLYQCRNMTFHTYKPQPMSLPSITFLYTSEIKHKQDFESQAHCSKAKSRLDNDVEHLQLPPNVPIKIQACTPFGV